MGDDRFSELMHALTRPDVPWSYPEQPSILLALDEVIAWANDDRQYDERMHKAGWVSAGKDFIVAIDSLGTSVQQTLKQHLDEIRKIWHDDIGGDTAARARLADEATALRRSLAATSTLKAAWQDLRRASGRIESSVKVVSSKRDTFWAIVEAADRNSTELSQRLADVLTGSAINAFMARAQLGEVEPNSVNIRSLFDAPSIDPIERLQLVEKLLEVEPTERVHVVWFAFKDAHMQTIGLDLENFKFYWAEWLRGNLDHGKPFRPEIPIELHDLEEHVHIPENSDVVLVRVDLGKGAFSDAVRVASERLDALLEVSTLGRADQWQWLSGYMHFQDQKLLSQRYFDYESRANDSRYLWSSTASQIDHMAPRVAPMIPIQDQKMRDIIGALHWWRVGLDHPTATAVILNVRVIELIASRVNETSWTTFLEKYLKNWWIRHIMESTAHFALHEALHRRVGREMAARQREIFLQAMMQVRGQQRMNVSKAVTHLDEIIEFIPKDLPLARDLRSLRQRTSNSDAVEAWRAELERVWNGQVHRLERIRNAIGHGGPFNEGAVLLAQEFSQQVSIHALWEAIEGFLHGKSLEQSYFDFAQRGDRWRTSLRAATVIGDLFC